MRTALMPGSFNPPTLGHLDIIERAAKICDLLYIGIAHNVHKPVSLFSTEQRKEILSKICRNISKS
jgi:pantetheine-phosphate adenylyltransferase